VHVSAAADLGYELDGASYRQSHLGDLGEFVAELDRGVAGADHDDSLTGVQLGIAVLRHV
jgi:hypothetical protein